MNLLTPLARGLKAAQGPFRMMCSDFTARRPLRCTAWCRVKVQGDSIFECYSFVWREPMFEFEFDQALFEFA